MGTQYGYVRVSTQTQNTDRQVDAMREFGIAEKDLFVDKQSGKDFSRPAYKRLLRRLRAGDTLVVKSIDRMGRQYAAILEQWRVITREKGADIVVLDMPLLDTRQKDLGLTGTLLSDIFLSVLSYAAELERSFIRQRQAEGIAAAKARGVRFGQEKIEMPPEFFVLRDKWRCGELSARKAGAILHVSYQTFLRRAREEGEQG